MNLQFFQCFNNNLPPMIHPADQISTLLLYGNESKISGERYQSVTTTDVNLILKSYVFYSEFNEKD